MKNASLYITRALFYGFILYNIHPDYFLNFSTLPEALWMPQGLFQFFEGPLNLSSGWISALSWTWYLTAIFSGLSIRFKESSLIFAVTNLFIFNLSQSYGYQTHSHMALVMGSLIMALAGTQTTLLMRIMYCMIFFSAAISKLRNGGLDWIFSDSLQNILIRSQIYYSDAQAWASSFNLNLFIAKHSFLCRIIAGLVICLELSAPLALINRRFSQLIVPSLLLMQIGIFFTILVNFKFYFLMYIFWIDWDWLLNRFLRILPLHKMKK